MNTLHSVNKDNRQNSGAASVVIVKLSETSFQQKCLGQNSTSINLKQFVNVSGFRLALILTWITLLSTSIIVVSGSQEHSNNHTQTNNFSSSAIIPNSTVNNDGGHRNIKRNTNDTVDNRNQSAPAALVLKPEHFTIPIGGVIHLFPRYGYFHLSMKVISKTDKNGHNSTISQGASSASSSSSTSQNNESWIFLEPVNNVLDPTTYDVDEASISPSNDNHSLPFHNLFHIDLCEDIKELMEAYFKNFSVEGLDKPWQAFSGGWRVPSIARYFGIDQAYVEGDYRYILVKVLLVRGSGTVMPMRNTTVSSMYHPNFQRFKPNNDLSTYEFFKVVGTHYIHAYIVGNAVYQVFVYDPDGFQNVKKRLFYDGIRHQSTSAFMEKLPELLSIWVKHTGRVFVLSATPEVLGTVRKALTMQTAHTGSISNLFKLHNNSKLVHQIEKILAGEPNAVLGIDLRGIHFLFKDPIQRAGFEKALKHQMQLWEINFQY